MIRHAITEAQVFVFTMGLAEGWENSTTGVAYAMCPGTLAGEFDPAQHIFMNYKHHRILIDMCDVLRLIRKMPPQTAVFADDFTGAIDRDRQRRACVCDHHTVEIDATLLARGLHEDHSAVDYFPSYEVIASPPFRGMVYQPNQREVSLKGGEVVLSRFGAAPLIA